MQAQIEYPETRSFALPRGQEVVVAPLHPRDAPGVQAVMARAWDVAYVGPGLMSPELRAEMVDPNSPSLVAKQAERIRAARERLANGDRAGALYLGAFASSELVGLAKISEYQAQTWLGRLWHKLTDRVMARSIGYVEEIDVDPDYFGQGVGRALAAVALDHLRHLEFTELRLHVVRDNERAIGFYRAQLGMAKRRTTSLDSSFKGNPKLRRDLYSAPVSAAQRALYAANPFIARAKPLQIPQ